MTRRRRKRGGRRRRNKNAVGPSRIMILLQPLNVGGIILNYEIYVTMAKRNVIQK
jgi:hypothetical protein